MLILFVPKADFWCFACKNEFGVTRLQRNGLFLAVLEGKASFDHRSTPATWRQSATQDACESR